MPNATNDRLIVEALDRGYFTTDPDTGWVLRDNQPFGYADNKQGYIRVGYRGATLCAHRIIWIAANGPVGSHLQINHRNDHKWDNRLINLEAVTGQQNMAHGRRASTYTGVLPADVGIVDPTWLTRALELAKNPNATHEQIRALVGELSVVNWPPTRKELIAGLQSRL